MIFHKQKYPKFQLIPVLVAIIFTSALLPLTTYADDNELKDIKEQQLKLKQLLDQISELQDERNQQRATLEKINRQMQCNWSLIKAYDACENQNKENLEGQINCKLKAKEEAKNCLSSTEKK